MGPIDRESMRDTITFRSLAKMYAEEYEKARSLEEEYMTKLEKASTNVDIFKYLLLIDTKALDAYVSQTKLQAEQSFRISKFVAFVGFIIIAVGVSVGIGTTIQGGNRLDAAYLTSLAGILTEFISGVFFYLYNKTLQQINIFHDKLLASKKLALDYLSESLKAQIKIEEYDEGQKDEKSGASQALHNKTAEALRIALEKALKEVPPTRDEKRMWREIYKRTKAGAYDEFFKKMGAAESTEEEGAAESTET